MLKKILNIFRARHETKQPEDAYITTITASSVRVEHPRRPVEEIRWNEIEEIRLINTDEGPFLPDIWLLLTGNGKGCSIPHGSKGFDEVYEIVSKYDGFDFEGVTASMTCADNAVFELWKKPEDGIATANDGT